MRKKVLTLLALLVMCGTFSIIPMLPSLDLTFDKAIQDVPIEEMPAEEFPNEVLHSLSEGIDDYEPGIDPNYDIGTILADKPNQMKTIFEPWKTKAAIHAVAYDEMTGFLALGGGYLYDNEVHIWRLNEETYQFDKVWDSGDSILRSDVIDLAWGDTDINDFREVVAASADGFVYLFEQRHIFDPQANTENMFDHVWTSPHTFRAFDVAIYDADRDYREDIIVGSWDGKVRCFEYDDHSNYPFSDEHWISFREVWNSGDTIEGRIYTVGHGDTNYNGLPEIVAGTREGRVYVFENDGVHLMIDGQPFPLINDNNYKVVWTSKNYTWTPIMDMRVGELDNTPGEEIALVAQGQGVFVLNWDEMAGNYDYRKVYRPWDNWQTSEVAPWRLDFWADSFVSANNVTFRLANGTEVPEPIEYVYVGAGMFDPDAAAYPYNTGLANATDGWYSYFHADTAPNATAVVDFGKDEEGTGSASAAWDMILKFALPPSTANLNLSIGQSATDFEQINVSNMFVFGNYLYVDVDDVLAEQQWDWFRYLKISVFNGVLYEIDSIELMQVYTQITSALTIEIGPLPEAFNLYGPPDEDDRLIVSTVIGNFYAFDYNESTDAFDLIWDSSRDDFYAMGTNVWDMIYVGSETRIPIWLQGGLEYPANPGSGIYGHWTISDMEFWEVAGSQYPHEMIVVDDTNDIRVFTPNGPDLLFDTDKTGYFNPVEAEIVGDMGPGVQLSVETPIISYTYPQTAAAVGAFDPTLDPDDLYGSDVGEMMANIYFFQRPAADVPYENLNYPTMDQLDVTGDIVTALANAKTLPRMEFVDWDGDFDFDMILSTGFLYYCENIGSEDIGAPGVWSQFQMVKGFFEDLNTDEEMNDYWGQPETWDIDQDGDLDLILSYDERKGATCYLNDGTMDDPVWKKTKKLFSNTRPETNLKFQNYTGIRIAPMGWGTMADFWQDFNSEMTTFQDAEYTMWAYDTDVNSLGIFWPVYTQSSSYIVATYPTVSRLEFAVQTENANNFGYHIMESWNTEADLEEWTLSVRTGDVDDDGHGEVIVGDYDNNIYIFEHMLNNTYKRAFRSFDINYTEVSDTSPYMWEDLEGINATFNRVNWNHVKHLLADVDLDSDGYKELIAAAGLQVYVFEDTGIDDTYEHAYTFDMRYNPYTEDDGWEKVPEVTAIGNGDDFDINGEKELLIAAGPFLFVYNIPYDTWTNTSEYFMGETPEGKFYLVGNGANEDFEEASIEAMTLCDPDEDGYKDLIIGGRINTTQIRQDGFVHIYEWNGAGFLMTWEAPEEVTFWNPVTSIALDDQDYDSKQEIIIGHSKGFDIWEWTGSVYKKVEVVTSSPNYPYIQLNTSRFYNDIYKESMVLTHRGDNDVEYFSRGTDLYTVSVFCQANDLYWKIHYGQLGFWSTSVVLYSGVYPGYSSTYTVNAMEPSLYLHSNGTLYCTWRTYINDGTPSYQIWISKYDVSQGNWVTPVSIDGGGTGSSNNRRYPSAFEFADGHLGVSYVWTPQNRVYVRETPDWGSSPWTGWGYVYFKYYDKFYVQSQDMYRMPSGDYALAISGRNSTLSKTDYDIFVGTSNSSFIWENTSMYQATSSYHNEINPDLGMLDEPEESLIVVYETVEADIEDRIQMSYSNPSYTIWRQNEPLATLPPYIERIELPGKQVRYQWNDTHQILAPLALSPSVVGRRGGGFMYMHAFDYWSRFWTDLAPNGSVDGAITQGKSPYDARKYHEATDLLFGINPSRRFTHFNIRGVVDLDVGDTDRDGRREVVAGFDDRAGSYELKHSNVGGERMQHEEVWLTNPLPYDVTGVSVYDTNDNGYDDVSVSCERGEVFVFEVDDVAIPPINLLHSKDVWNTTIGNPTTQMTGTAVVIYDIDDDGKDEIFRGESDGTIRAFDDDGTQLWENDDYSGAAYWMEIGRRGPGSTQMYLIVGRFGDASGISNATLIVADTGVTQWHRPFPTSPFPDLLICSMGDVAGDSESEILITNVLDQLFVYDLNGVNVYNSTWPISWQGMSITTGNFSDNAKNDIALVHTNGSVTVLHGHNGTVMYTFNKSIGLDYQKPILADINDDGWDDLVLGKLNLFVFDLNNRSVLYNGSNNNLGQAIDKLYVGDYDNDTLYEVITQTDNQVVYEEVTSGRLVWRYRIDSAYTIRDSMAMTLPNGRDAIAICTTAGDVAAIDAITGVVKWFAQSSNSYNEIIVGNFDNDPQDELGASDDTTGDIYIYEELIPWMTTPSDPFYLWTLYWNDTISNSAGWEVMGLWTEDLDADGVTDYIVSGSDGLLRLYDPINAQLQWSRSLDFIALDVQFGEFTGDSTTDLLLLMQKSGGEIVMGLDGSNGQEIPSLREQAPHESDDIHFIAVANFDDSSSGDEYAVVFTDSSNTTWVEFFGNDGSRYAVSSFNGTFFYPTHAVTGRLDLTGDANHDLFVGGITGGVDGDVHFWEGDGTHSGSWSGSYPFIRNIKVGNFDNDAIDDLTIGFEGGLLWSWEIGAAVSWAVMMNGTIDSLQTIDLDASPTDEIIINVREIGVIATDGAVYNEHWTYLMPTASAKQTLVTDIDGDGSFDLSILLEDRFTLIDLEHDEIFGAFDANGPIDYLRFGNFDDTGPLDVMFYVGATVYTVTDHTTPPPVPLLAEDGGSVDLLRVSLMIGVPPLFLLVAIPLFIRRRRRGR